MKDTSLFHYATPGKVHRYLGIKNDPVFARNTVEVCFDIYEGDGDCIPHEAAPHPSSGGTTSCGMARTNSRDICVTIDLGGGSTGGGGGGPTGGGGNTGGGGPIGGGGPTGGGGGGTGGGWNENPCKAIGTSNPCGGGGGGWMPVDPVDGNGYYQSRIDVLKQKLQENPEALIPCKYLSNFHDISTHQVPASVLNEIDVLENNFLSWVPVNAPQNFYNDPLYIQDINDASGSVLNFDYFPIKISHLPIINGVQWTPYQLLEHFRLNINSFINNQIATFTPYNEPWANHVNLWNSNNPLGALLHLDMANDGSVIVSEYTCAPTQFLNNYYYVTTLVTPLDGYHPVSGNRKWGIFQNQDGSYTFYTSGVDRITTNLFEAGSDLMNIWSGNSGFDDADDLWKSMQQKMVQFINDPQHGGSASYYDNGNPGNLGEEVSRPQWNDVKKFLRKQITYEELRILMGCP